MPGERSSGIGDSGAGDFISGIGDSGPIVVRVDLAEARRRAEDLGIELDRLLELSNPSLRIRHHDDTLDFIRSYRDAEEQKLSDAAQDGSPVSDSIELSYDVLELLARSAGADKITRDLPILLEQSTYGTRDTIQRASAYLIKLLQQINDESTQALNSDFEARIGIKDVYGDIGPMDRYYVLWMMRRYVVERLAEAENNDDQESINRYNDAKKLLDTEIQQCRVG